MKKVLLIGLVVCLGAFTLLNAGCAKKAASSSDAIQTSQTLKSVQEKVDYLIGQANTFYNSKEFQQAIQTCQYILSNLDNKSQQAQSLIEKAKTQLQATAQKAITDVRTKLLGK